MNAYKWALKCAAVACQLSLAFIVGQFDKIWQKDDSVLRAVSANLLVGARVI